MKTLGECQYCGKKAEFFTCSACTAELDEIIKELGGMPKPPSRGTYQHYTDSGEPAGRPGPTSLSGQQLRGWKWQCEALMESASKILWKRITERSRNG